MDFNPDILQHKLDTELDSFQHDELSEFRSSVLKKTLLKKYVPLGFMESLHEEAMLDFLRRNEDMTNIFVVPNHRKELFFAWRDTLHRIFLSGEYQTNICTLDSLVQRGYAGPGASRGTKHTDFVGKMFASKLTYTRPALYRHYVTALSPRWYKADKIRSDTFSEKQVSGSLLNSVPKDSKKNRTICTEPSLNMFYQLGAKQLINSLLLRHYHLDVSTQPEINKKLAWQGSIDGKNATLDLSNASDSIHLELCRQLLPESTFAVLDLIRSQNFEYGGKVHRFNMISSMGNGYTFSLMTLLLTSLLDVFLHTKRTRYVPLRDGVFGDDIILPNVYADEFCEVLADFGFKVNLDKSFIQGSFRESCGGDYYHGHNVRGVYIKEINNEAQAYSAFNRLHRWSVTNGIPIPDTLLYLKGLVDFRPIPFDEADDAGHKIPSDHLTSRKRDCNGAIYYKALVATARSRHVGDSEYNPFGTLIGAVGGYVRGQRISMRSNMPVRYKVRKKLTPTWDYIPGGGAFLTAGLTVQDYVNSWSELLSSARG